MSFINKHIPALAIILSGSALVLAWIFEYGFGYLPCTMCYWQRYAHVFVIFIAVSAQRTRYMILLQHITALMVCTKWSTPVALIITVTNIVSKFKLASSITTNCQPLPQVSPVASTLKLSPSLTTTVTLITIVTLMTVGDALKKRVTFTVTKTKKGDRLKWEDCGQGDSCDQVWCQSRF